LLEDAIYAQRFLSATAAVEVSVSLLSISWFKRIEVQEQVDWFRSSPGLRSFVSDQRLLAYSCQLIAL